jgi:hypothetical protein
MGEPVEEISAQAKEHLARMHDAVTEIRQHLEQAKTVASEVGAVSAAIQATSGQARDVSAQVTAMFETARAATNAASDAAARAEALRTQVEQAAQVAETRSAHIEEGRKYVDAKRAEIDVILNSALQSAAGTTAHQASARATVESLTALHTTAQQVVVSAQGLAEDSAAVRASVEEDSQATKRLAQIAAETEARIAKYEARLAELDTASASQGRVIDELLLGATNAGLATAFDKRGQTFKKPAKNWQAVFVLALAGLLALAIVEALVFGASATPGWTELARMAVHRLPFLIPLVWLAIHAARQAALAMRMEEEYGYKATISTSFEGYRRQMAEVGKDLTLDSPLARLCGDTLRTLSKPPSDVYDKHRMDPNLGTEAAEKLVPLLEEVSKVASRIPGLKG